MKKKEKKKIYHHRDYRVHRGNVIEDGDG